MKKKILILTDHMPWGHRSIAKAIYANVFSQAKKENWEVHYAEVKAETGLAGDIYVFLYRYFPVTNRLIHSFFSSRSAKKALTEITEWNLPRLKKLVERLKPDLIISSYFFHSHTLAKWREEERKDFGLWTVVADPRSMNYTQWVDRVDLHLVYDQVALETGVKEGIAKDKIMVTGWWVRPEMYAHIDRQLARRKLGFIDDRPVIFVGGGSLGTNSWAKLLPALLLVNRKVGIIFNSGTDRLAQKMVKEYMQLIKRLRRSDLVQIKNLGWIENMGEVLTACDLVMGKAGPNFLFDVIARKKPFVAITHIGGQEDGNIELIIEKKLGWIREKNSSAAKFLLDYIRHPGKYANKFKKYIEAESDSNNKGCSVLIERIKQKLETRN